MTDKFISSAKRRCGIVMANHHDNWRGELLVRMNKLIKRNYTGKPGAYDQSEITEIRMLLGWNEVLTEIKK